MGIIAAPASQGRREIKQEAEEAQRAKWPMQDLAPPKGPHGLARILWDASGEAACSAPTQFPAWGPGASTCQDEKSFCGRLTLWAP